MGAHRSSCPHWFNQKEYWVFSTSGETGNMLKYHSRCPTGANEGNIRMFTPSLSEKPHPQCSRGYVDEFYPETGRCLIGCSLYPLEWLVLCDLRAELQGSKRQLRSVEDGY